MKFRPYTVIVLIGPSNCGKTTFAEQYLKPRLENTLRLTGITPNVAHISSDACRREVLGDPSGHKYGPRMMHVSEKAFKLLHGRIDAATAWPHPAHFVIVDTTGLNDGFRRRVIEQARAAKYNVAAVIFDYKRRGEYERHVAEQDLDKRIQAEHINRMRNGLYRTLKAFDYVERVRSKDFDKLPIEVVDVGEIARAHLDPTLTWDVVGDVHGCYDELLALLAEAGYSYEDGRLTPPEGHGLILNGDLIDKGDKSFEVLRLAHMHRNEPWFKVTLGNHENFVVRYLLGQVKEPTEDVLTHFDTAVRWSQLVSDGYTWPKQMLLDVRDVASPFWDGRHFVVTHAPCRTKHIGKLDAGSVRMQQGQYRRPRRDGRTLAEWTKDLETSLSFIKDEAIGNAPWHIFGHVAIKNGLWLKNKIGIDTGCVEGGSLTMVSIPPQGRPRFRSVPTTRPATEELPTLWDEPERDIDLATIDRKEYGRIMWLARNKVNFVSGTMAPADADPERGVLESLDKALAYYQRAGVESVVLQPKYMGSRCNVYLHKDPEKCYAVSRNGHVIHKERVDLAPVFERLRERFVNSLADGTMIVLDGELMPWRALGADLIDEQFKVVGLGARSELDALRSLGFEEMLEHTRAGIPSGVAEMPKDDAIKAYGHARLGTWRNLMDRPVPRIGDLLTRLDIYEAEVARHGADGPPDFKPFGVLKVIRLDGTEENWQQDGHSNVKHFLIVGEEIQHVLNLNDDWQSARDFFASAAERGLEGVVVKPAVIRNDVAPALKVRNPNYLSIVYGYDYTMPAKHERLVRSKRTHGKREASMREFRIGQRMLAIPRAEIGEENETYLRLAAAMVVEEQRERSLDPRL